MKKYDGTVVTSLLRHVGRLGYGFILGASVLSYPGECRANTEIGIPYNGQIPYLVVLQDNQGGSSRAPGIHISDSQGTWHPAIPGKVLAGGTSRGVLAQLSITDLDRRYESVAVIDGKIRIFHINSNEEANPSSLITIGDDEHPLYDVNGQPVFNLPPLENIEHISIYAAPHGREDQLLLFSVKLPTPQVVGDGITFAVLLKKASQSTAPELELAHAPVVIDYKFQNYAQLSSLIHPSSNGHGVISRLTLRALFRQYRKQTIPSLQKWHGNVESFLRTLESGGETQRSSSLPYFDVKAGRTRLIDLPMESHAIGNYILATQVHDPLTGNDGIVFQQEIGSGHQNAIRYDLHGRIDQNSNNGFHIYTALSPGNRSNIGLVYVNRELYFLAINDKNEVVRLKLGGSVKELPETLALQSVSVQSSDTETHGSVVEHYVFVSFKQANPTQVPERTEFFLINQQGSTLSLTRSFKVLDRFVQDTELKERIRMHPVGEKEKVVLFDNITPAQAKAESYKQAARPTIPFMDMTQTAHSNSYVQTYIQPTEEKLIGNSQAVYKQFDPTGANRNQTGVFLYDNKKKVTKTILGQLLGRPGHTDPEFFSKEIQVEKTNMKVSVVAIDSGHDGGKTSFQLATLITHAGSNGSDRYFLPIVDTVRFSLPFSRLSGVHFFQEKKGHRNQIHVLCSFAPSREPGVDMPNGGLLAVALRLAAETKNGENTVSVGTQKTHWLTEKVVTSTELLARLRGGDDGKMYWAATPEVAQTDPNYLLVNIATGAQIRLNSTSAKGTKLISEEAMRKELREIYATDDEYGYGSNYSSWEVYGKYTVENRIRKIENPETAKTALKNLFAGLDETLDALAGPNSKPEHQVLLVASDLKEQFLNHIFLRWIDESNSNKGNWHLDNKNISFYWPDHSKGTQKDILRNLELIKAGKEGRKPILLADAEAILNFGRPQVDSESKYFSLTDVTLPEAEQAPILPHMAYLLETEGASIDLDHFKSQKNPQHRISMVIVATPEEWEQLQQEMGPEKKFRVLERIKRNPAFLTSSWKVWAPGSRLATKDTILLKDQPISDLERDVFPTLISTLQEMADVSKPAKHKILIVPDELKPLIKRMTLSGWVANRGNTGDLWSYRNPMLDLYRFSHDGQGQDGLLAQLKVMREVAQVKRTFMTGDLSDIRKAGRLSTNANNNAAPRFTIKDAASGQTSSLIDGADDAQAVGGAGIPHALYLLETEGRPIQPHELAKEAPGQKNRISMLFVGSKSEWEALTKELSIEARYDLANRFEKIELKTPSTEARRGLLNRIASSPQIQGLGYRFNADDVVAGAKNLSPSEAREKLLGYLTNRAETLANQSHQEPTAAFIKVLTEFSRSLVEDTALRNSKVIDRSYLERLLSKTFSIPLNLKILPPNDPLVKLSGDDAPLLLQDAGYEGPLDLKAQVIRAMLAQTRNDPVRPIPSSVILFGDTSSGKTFLFKTLCKVQGLKSYDFNNPNDESAGAITINAGRLTSESTLDNPETMSVADAIKHLSNFMALPNGYRGNILIDDIHKAPEDVVSKLLTYLQSIFEANNGMIRVKNMRNETREIPVRNLTIFMTLNPTDDQAKLSRFKQKGDDTEVVVATLSGQQYQLERSFLQRWGLILNISKFPIEAKAPKLQESLRAGARNDFNVQGHLAVVSPSTVNALVKKFPEANAREFLSVASSQLLQMPNNSSEPGSLFVMVPATEASGIRPNGGFAPWRTNPGGWGEATGRSNTEIEAFIRQSTIAVPVDKRVDGQLHLLSIMLDTFRTSVYESLINAVTQSPQFAASAREMRSRLAPMLHGITANFATNPYIPLSALALDPYEFNAKSRMDQEEFRRIVDADSHRVKQTFPIRFADELESHSILAELLDHSVQPHDEKSRVHVLTEYAERLNGIFTTYLQYLMRVQSLRTLPDSEAWLKSLREAETTVPLKETGRQMAEIFLEMWGKMYDPGLIENMPPEQFKHMTTYDAVRLYVTAIDRAIAKLPWGTTTKFMVKGLSRAASDMDLGQIPGVQHYLFTSKQSLVRPATHELLVQMAITSSAYKEWPEEQRAKVEAEFRNKCERLLKQK